MGNNIYNWVILPVDRKENFVYKKEKGVIFGQKKFVFEFSSIKNESVNEKDVHLYQKNVQICHKY